MSLLNPMLIQFLNLSPILSRSDLDHTHRLTQIFFGYHMFDAYVCPLLSSAARLLGKALPASTRFFSFA